MPTALELLKNKSTLQMTTDVVAEWNYNVFVETRTRGVIRNKSGELFGQALPSGNTHIDLNSDTNVIKTNTKNRIRRPDLSFEEKFTAVASSRSNNSASALIANINNISNLNAYRISFYARADKDTKFTLTFLQFKDSYNLKMSESKAFDINSLEYTKHEFLYWPNSSDVNKIRIYIHSENGPEDIYFSNFSVVTTTLYEYNTQEIFRLKDVFEGWRPGEQKAHFSSTDQLSKSLFYSVNQNTASDIPQIVMPVEESGGRMYAPSYQRSSYYCDVMSSPDNIPQRGIFAIYDEPMDVNKLVFKTLNGRSYSKINRVTSSSTESGKIVFGNYIAEYKLWLLEKEGESYTWKEYSSTAKFKQNGALILNWNGSSWVSTDSPIHATINGTSLSNVKTICGLALNIVSIKLFINDDPTAAEPAGTSINSDLAKKIDRSNPGVDLNIRFLEASPRLTINMTQYLQSFSISSETDSGEYFVPVGLASANSGSMAFDNLPRLLNNKTVPLLSDISGTAALSNKLERNIKFTITYNLNDGAGSSAPGNRPLAVLFSDTWSAEDDGIVKVELFDYAKYLQTQRTTPFLYIRDVVPNSTSNAGRSALVGRIISDWLIANNFTDFEISESITNGTVESFFSDPQYNVWEVLQELLLAYQLTGYFDNNGILKFDNYLDPDGVKNSETPIFKFTDTALDGYISNIEEFSMDQREKPSSIKILYKTTSPKVSTDVGDNDVNKQAFISTRAPEILFEPESYEGLGIATLARKIDSNDKQIHLNKRNWNTGQFIWPEYSGYAVIGSEIIKYDGIIHSYTLLNNVAGLKKLVVNGVTTTIVQTLHPHYLEVNDSLRIKNLSSAYLENNTINVSALNGAKTVLSVISEYEFSISGNIAQLSTDVYAGTVFGDIKSDKRKEIKNRSDLENLKAAISQQIQDAPLDTSIEITNLGILSNVERGLFGTTAQNHGVVDSDNLVNDIPSNLKVKSYNNKTLESIPNIRTVLSHYKNKEDEVFLRLEGKNNKEKTLLYLSGVDSKSFTHYKFSFSLQEENKNPMNGAKDDVVGIMIGFRETANGATNDPGDGLYIELVPETNKKNTSSIYMIKNGIVQNKKQSNFKLDVMNIKKEKRKEDKDKDKEDGKDGKGGKGKGNGKPREVKLTWQKHQTVIVTIDKDGKTVGVTVNGDRLKFGSGKTRSEEYDASVGGTALFRQGMSIGMYATNNSTLLLNSLSAYNTNHFMVAPDMEITQNLDPILINGKYNSLPFYYSANPYVHGMAIKEIQFDKGPAFNIKIFKPNGSYKIKDKNNKNRQKLFKVSTSSTVCSYPMQGTYMSKFLIINVSDQIIPFNSNENFSPLMVSGDILTQSGERFVKQDLPKNTGSETLEIGSDWIQSESSAERILRRLYSQVDNSAITYDLKVFGNPAIQIGDVVSLHYSQANITDSSAKYYIISIDQEYDGGLETSIRLRKITS